MLSIIPMIVIYVFSLMKVVDFHLRCTLMKMHWRMKVNRLHRRIMRLERAIYRNRIIRG